MDVLATLSLIKNSLDMPVTTLFFIVGIILTCKTKFIQLRALPRFIDLIKKGVVRKEVTNNKGDVKTIDTFHALFTAMSTTIGIGNLVGPTVAIFAGGPGAMFWLLLYIFLGSVTKFTEVVFAMVTRVKTDNGHIIGGPMQYLKHVSHFFANWFMYVMAFLFIGWTMVQSNTLAEMYAHEGVPEWATGLALAAITFYVLMGGAKRVGEFAAKLVPIMFFFYISGHVLADSKEKLSKSKQHKAMSPEHLLEQYSADVIRYWTASGNLGHDVAFSENQLKIGRKLVTKIWNAFRFTKEHITAVNTSELPTKFGLINEWLLHEVSATFAKYQAYLEKNEFGLALNAIESFFWQTFCDNYLELIKDQLFNPDNYDHDELYATRWTLHQVGLRILQLYAPYLPFVTEEIYALIYKDSVGIDSVHKTKFADTQTPYNFANAAQHMQLVLQVISSVRKLKTTHQLSLRQELQTLKLFGDDALLSIAQKHEALIKGATKALEISYEDASRNASELKQDGEMWHAIVFCENE